MKKILCVTLAVLMCIAMMVGCTTNENPTTTNAANSPSGTENNQPAWEGIKITDKYTYTDPADVEFDTRYVLYMGPESALVAPTVEKGQLYQYTIIYGKEDVAMGECTLYVCDSNANAQKIKAEMESYGMVADILEEDDTIIRVSNDQYALDATLSIYVMAEMIKEATASAYVGIYTGTYGATLQE